jgi:AcrR family transcriptional regulator
MVQKEDKNDLTRERLLNEAEALFAERGYHAVSVREITRSADCNLAAVNYHFGNKQNLYVEVFQARWVPRAKRVQEYFRQSLASQGSPSPRTVAQALAEAFLEGPLSDQERQRHHQLMTKELSRPSEAFGVVAEQVIRPFIRELADTLRTFMRDDLAEERLMLSILSMFSGVLYFNFARVAVTRITGREYDPAFKARLIEHIVEFSLKGWSAIEKKGLP